LEIGVFEGVGQFLPNFQVEGKSPPTIFAQIDKSVNALGQQLCRWQHSHKETL